MPKEKEYFPSGNVHVLIREGKPSVIVGNNVQKEQLPIYYKVEKASVITGDNTIQNGIRPYYVSEVVGELNRRHSYLEIKITSEEVENAFDAAFGCGDMPLWDKKGCIERVKGKEFSNASVQIDRLSLEVERLRRENEELRKKGK